MISKYYEFLAFLEQQKCPNCKGLGTCNDADPGDISYNEWVCPECDGTGFIWWANTEPFLNAIAETIIKVRQSGNRKGVGDDTL